MAADTHLPLRRLPELRLYRHRVLICLLCMAMTSSWAAQGGADSASAIGAVGLDGRAVALEAARAGGSAHASRWSLTQEVMPSEGATETEPTSSQFNREPASQRQRTVMWQRHRRLLAGVGIDSAWADPHQDALNARWGPLDRSHDAVVVGVGIQANRQMRLSWEHELVSREAPAEDPAAPHWRFGNGSAVGNALQKGLRVRMSLGAGSALTLRGRSRGVQLGYARRW